MHRACRMILLLAFTAFACGQEKTKQTSQAQSAAPAPAPVDLDAKARLMQKMDEIIIPSVRFKKATPGQVLEFLRKSSRELDKSPADSAERGVNIILRTPDSPDGPSITLNLKNVTLAKALLAVAEQAMMVFKVEAHGVVVSDMHAYRNERHTRIIDVPPDFLSAGQPKPGQPSPADPFAAPPPEADPSTSRHRWKTAQQILEAAGIPFPENSSASFNPLTNQLTVTNTLPNLDLVEGYANSIQRPLPATVAYTLTIIEGPGELIRDASTQASLQADASPALATLLDHAGKPDSNVRVVSDAFVEAQSGTRATLHAVREHRFTADFKLDAQGHAASTQETHPLGLHLDIEPTVGSDGASIETMLSLSLSLNPAPPVQRQATVSAPLTGHPAGFPLTDIPGTKITTSFSLSTRATKLIGITKAVGTPQEKADILRAVFISAALRRVEYGPRQQQMTSPAPLPEGMLFASLQVPDALFDAVLHECQPATLQSWLARAGASFPPGSVLDHHGGVLRCVNTPDNLALIMALVDQRLADAPKTVALTFHTIAAPAPLLRDLTRQTLASADDSSMFAAVEAAAARGEARFLSSTFVETKPGNRATQQAAPEHRYLESQDSDDHGRPSFSFDTRHTGVLLEAEPVIGTDNRTVELILNHELHSAPPVTHRLHFSDPASQQPFDIPATDFNLHKTTTGINLSPGSTRLLSFIPPSGRDETGVLWATFVKCDVIPQVARSPYFQITPPAPSKSAQEVHTRAYRIPPDFLSAGGDAGAPDGNKKPKTARDILEAVGISFPPGTAAYCSTTPSPSLVVTNTNENLDLIEAYVGGGCYSPIHPVSITLHVVQGPGPLLRRLTAQASGKNNHRTELNELLAAVKAGTLQHLDMAHIETKSGVRATTVQATKHSAITEVSVNDKGETFYTQEPHEVGLNFELEPTVASDIATIDLTLSAEYHTAPPLEHREHLTDIQGRRLEFPLTDYFTSKLTTGITIPDGTARLLSLYKPSGKAEFEKEDILQAIFITCDILRPEK